MLTATLPGSWPPPRFPPPSLSDHEVEEAIQAAVTAQLDAVRGRAIAWLFVDGQPRTDIVDLFAPVLGLIRRGIRYHVPHEIRYTGPLILSDLQVAARACGERPLKAHITDPVLIAQACDLSEQAKPAPRYKGEAGFRTLVLDLAQALAAEVRAILAAGLPVTHVQIDAPRLAYSPHVDLTCEAIAPIARAARSAGASTILHVCGNAHHIVGALLEIPVDILNVEASHLREWSDLTPARVARSGKRFALGCLPVNTADLPSDLRVRRELQLTVERCGIEHIWGVTSNCGLRHSHPAIALELLARLVTLAEAGLPA